MSLTLQLTTSVVIAIVAATLLTLMKSGGLLDPVTLAAFLVATIATALATGQAGRHGSASDSPAPATRAPQGTAAGGERMGGQVKWFNVSKGFGFIIPDEGEEIFVHFRSIRGTGRRSLRDGQRVSFVVAEGEKGPQAEDVCPE